MPGGRRSSERGHRDTMGGSITYSGLFSILIIACNQLGTYPSLQRHCVASALRSAGMQGVGTYPSLQRHCVASALRSAGMQGGGGTRT